jgi:hypothetical protein
MSYSKILFSWALIFPLNPLFFFSSAHAESNIIRYWCSVAGNDITTEFMYPSGKQGSFIRWTTGSSPEEQCRDSAKRFEKHQISDGWKVMARGRYNDSKVICAVKSHKRGIVQCNESNVLIFLNEYDDDDTFLKKLICVLDFTCEGPAEHSSIYGEDEEGGRWVNIRRLLTQTPTF